MTGIEWPEHLFSLIMTPRIDEVLAELGELAEDEPGDWNYQHTQSDHERPILRNFIIHTYKRLSEEDKICVADDGQSITFNTGLVTPAQEPIYCLGVPNKLDDIDTPWHFRGWRRRGEHDASSPESVGTFWLG